MPTALSRSVTVDCLTRAAQLQGLASEWTALWYSIPDRTPFQSSAWVLPWWQVFGDGELRTLAIRDGARLIGLAPFYLSRTSREEGELRVVGAGVSDYLDVLVAPGADRPVAEAIERELHRSAAEWTFCGFDHLPPGSVLLQIRPQSGVRDELHDDVPCPVVPLADGARGLPDVLGARRIRDLRHQRRRAGKLGTVEIYTAADETLEEALACLFALHEARWQARGGAGVFGDPAARAFHQAAAPALLGAGLLRLLVVRVAGHVAAVHYGMQAGTCAYCYVFGFDPQLSAISPVKLAIAAAIESALDEGASAFNFLAGREPYKYEWGAADTPRLTRHWRRTADGRRG